MYDCHNISGEALARKGCNASCKKDAVFFFHEFIVFDGGRKTIHNTLRGCDLHPSNDLFSARAGVTQYRQQQKFSKGQDKLKPFEIWSERQNSTEKLKITFKQILYTHTEIVKAVGDCHMILDTFSFDDDAIMRYVLAMQLITEASLTLFDLRDPTLFGVEDDELGKVGRLLNKACQMRQKQRVKEPRFVTCDANLYDAAITSSRLELDRSPTGRVPQCANLVFNGLDIDPTRVNLKISNVPICILASLSRQLSSKTKVIDYFYSPTSALTNQQDLVISKRADLSAVNHIICSLPKKDILGLKRAGDWAQVEHCRQRRQVFVTRDRLAALYAYHRGVRFLFYRNIQQSFGIKHVFMLHTP